MCIELQPNCPIVFNRAYYHTVDTITMNSCNLQFLKYSQFWAAILGITTGQINLANTFIISTEFAAKLCNGLDICVSFLKIHVGEKIFPLKRFPP